MKTEVFWDMVRDLNTGNKVLEKSGPFNVGARQLFL
jgi:hypothetical protein